MGERLRIVFPMTGELIGGSVISSGLLARELLRRGHDVSIAMQGKGPALEHVMSLGLPFDMLPGQRVVPASGRPDPFGWPDLQAFPAMVRLLRKRQTQIVHVNEARTARLWPIAARLAGSRSILHWRGNYGPHGMRLLDLSFWLACRVVAISKRNRAPLPAFAQSKADVVLNPFESVSPAILPERSALRRTLGLPEGAAIIGMFGSFIARKRPHVLADIVAALPHMEDGRAVIGVLCGARMNPADTLLDERLSNPDLARRIIRPGHVDNVLEWMRACDLVIVPAKSEPLARTPVEAASVGVPSIISTECGIAEFMTDGENCLILPPEPLQPWVDATRRILEDAGLHDRIVSGAQAFMTEVSPEAHTDAIEQIYAKALATRR